MRPARVTTSSVGDRRPDHGISRGPSGGPVVAVDAVGRTSPAWRRTWTSDDLLLYALAVGAQPDELALATENSEGVVQRAVPSFAALVGGVGPGIREAIGPAWDPVRLVYASQGISWHRELPVVGDATLVSRVVAITGKGSGVLVSVDTEATGATGGADESAPLFTAHRSVFLRGASVSAPTGASPAGASVGAEPPAAGPTRVVRHRLSDRQALLYRLTGDRHPLHSDPSFARRAGFDRPILHGLCTYGVTSLLLLRHVADGDPARLRHLTCRFRAPVWPGDQLELEYDAVSPTEVRFVVRRTNDGRTVVDGGRLVLAADGAPPPFLVRPVDPSPGGAST